MEGHLRPEFDHEPCRTEFLNVFRLLDEAIDLVRRYDKEANQPSVITEAEEVVRQTGEPR